MPNSRDISISAARTGFTLTRRDLFRAAAALLPAAGFASLATAQDPTYSTDVKVVNVFATVHDKHGEIVRNLTKADFTLDEDGRPQTIRYFSQQSDLPLTLGLLVDTSMSQRRVLGAEKSASYRFLEQVLREDKDLAFVIHFDHEVELLQDLTSSRKLLEAALTSLDTPQLQRAGNAGGNGGGGGYPGGGGGGYPGGGRGGYGGRGRGGGTGGGGGRGAGTTLYDSILLASDELMKKQSGRKALILLTDGVDNGSKITINRAIEAAQRSDTLVYSILFADEQGYGGSHMGGFGIPGMGGGGMGGGGGRGGGGRGQRQERPDGKKVLQQISKETGGGFFEVSGKQPIEKIYEHISDELRNQYSIGYTSDAPPSPGTFRNVHLTLKSKDQVVQNTPGYYSK